MDLENLKKFGQQLTISWQKQVDALSGYQQNLMPTWINHVDRDGRVSNRATNTVLVKEMPWEATTYAHH